MCKTVRKQQYFAPQVSIIQLLHNVRLMAGVSGTGQNSLSVDGQRNSDNVEFRYYDPDDPDESKRSGLAW